MLYYLKIYPTFDVLGAVFGMSRSKACESLHALLLILCKALENLGVMPQCEFKKVAEFQSACAWFNDLMIDATERLHHRPSNAFEQKALYRAKKRGHTLKNTVNCSEIINESITQRGHR